MRPLYHYIRPLAPEAFKNNYVVNPVIRDGHCHVFSHRGICDINKHYRASVGFADIEFDHLNEYKNIPDMYDKYMKDVNVWKWLATALNIDDIKTIYNRHPHDIAGFGELKLYDNFRGKDINFKHISFARQVCKFSELVGCLPVYIHYELTNVGEVQMFDRLLTDFPEVPIVLCHCGMNEHNQEFAYGAARKLASEHGNCWLDISWDAAKFFYNNPLLITQLPGDRIFWGSDISPRLSEHDFKSASMSEIGAWEDLLTPYMDSDLNLQKLFKEI